MSHRPLCPACPWRDMDKMRREHGEVVRHAMTSPRGFVCHVRCGPCDGPIVMLRKEVTCPENEDDLARSRT